MSCHQLTHVSKLDRKILSHSERSICIEILCRSHLLQWDSDMFHPCSEFRMHIRRYLSTSHGQNDDHNNRNAYYSSLQKNNDCYCRMHEIDAAKLVPATKNTKMKKKLHTCITSVSHLSIHLLQILRRNHTCNFHQYFDTDLVERNYSQIRTRQYLY